MLKFHMNTNETEGKNTLSTQHILNSTINRKIKNKNLTIKTRIRKSKSKYKLI